MVRRRNDERGNTEKTKPGEQDREMRQEWEPSIVELLIEPGIICIEKGCLHCNKVLGLKDV